MQRFEVIFVVLTNAASQILTKSKILNILLVHKHRGGTIFSSFCFNERGLHPNS